MSYNLKQSLITDAWQQKIVAECNEIKLSSPNPNYPELFGTLPETIGKTTVNVIHCLRIPCSDYNPNKVNVNFYSAKSEIHYALIEKPIIIMAFGCECTFLFGYARYELEEISLPPGSVLVVYPEPNACLKFWYGIKQVETEEADDIPFSVPITTIVTVQHLTKNLFDLLR